MMAKGEFSATHQMPLHRFIRILVLTAHEITGFISAKGQNREAEIAVFIARIEVILATVETGVADGVGEGQTIIFPQGTRAAPDAKLPYKPGVLRLYQRFGLPLELAATNCGCFWPRFGVWRAPGTAVLEFVGSIPPGQDRKQVIAEVEERIETASDSLVAQSRS